MGAWLKSGTSAGRAGFLSWAGLSGEGRSSNRAELSEWSPERGGAPEGRGNRGRVHAKEALEGRGPMQEGGAAVGGRGREENAPKDLRGVALTQKAGLEAEPHMGSGS